MISLMVLIGLPGSGKTSWAIDYIEEHPTALRASRDSIREMLSGKYRFKKPNENLVLKLVQSNVQLCLNEVRRTTKKDGIARTVIVDDTNLIEKRRLSWYKIGKQAGCDTFEFVYFDVTPKECKQRRKKGDRGTSGKDWAQIIDDMDLWKDVPLTTYEQIVYKGKVNLRTIEDHYVGKD